MKTAVIKEYLYFDSMSTKEQHMILQYIHLALQFLFTCRKQFICSIKALILGQSIFEIELLKSQCIHISKLDSFNLLQPIIFDKEPNNNMPQLPAFFCVPKPIFSQEVDEDLGLPSSNTKAVRRSENFEKGEGGTQLCG